LNKPPPNSTDSGHFHAVRFYENSESLSRIVAEFLAEGIVAGQPALVIATPEHRAGIESELRARHFDLDKVQAAGDMVMLDARETLAAFMVEGLPNADLFRAAAVRAIEQACRGRENCTIRAYGEMVDVLWKDGLTVAAVRLEMLWNQLAMTHDFSLLCGYGMGNFYKDASMRDICNQHSHIVAPDGSIAPTVGPSPTIN
jgi:hypothetical protein